MPPKRRALKWYFCGVSPLKCPTSSQARLSPVLNSRRYMQSSPSTLPTAQPACRGVGIKCSRPRYGFGRDGCEGTDAKDRPGGLWFSRASPQRPGTLILEKMLPAKRHEEWLLPCSRGGTVRVASVHGPGRGARPPFGVPWTGHASPMILRRAGQLWDTGSIRLPFYRPGG